MKRQLWSLALMFLLVGCIHKPFQPAPDEWELWNKKGVAGKDNIEKAMLECGNPMWARAPFNRYEINHSAISQDILFERCMEKDGFRYTSELGTGCGIDPDIPECKLPIEQIPSRDISRRLNGVYCTKFPTAELCKP